jgi:hypothetical protein
VRNQAQSARRRAIALPNVLVMATKPIQHTRQSGQDWLLSCTRNPTDVRRAWASMECARIPSGEHWRVAEAPLLQSVVAMKRVGHPQLGPVLVDVARGRAWWLLPPGLGDGLGDVHHLTVHPAGWLLSCPPVLYAIEECGWLERPDGSGQLTDPAALGAAFGSDCRLHAGVIG